MISHDEKMIMSYLKTEARSNNDIVVKLEQFPLTTPSWGQTPINLTRLETMCLLGFVDVNCS